MMIIKNTLGYLGLFVSGGLIGVVLEKCLLSQKALPSCFYEAKFTDIVQIIITLLAILWFTEIIDNKKRRVDLICSSIDRYEDSIQKVMESIARYLSNTDEPEAGNEILKNIKRASFKLNMVLKLYEEARMGKNGQKIKKIKTAFVEYKEIITSEPFINLERKIAEIEIKQENLFMEMEGLRMSFYKG